MVAAAVTIYRYAYIWDILTLGIYKYSNLGEGTHRSRYTHAYIQTSISNIRPDIHVFLSGSVWGLRLALRSVIVGERQTHA